MSKIKGILQDADALRSAISYPITIAVDYDGNITGYREQVLDICPQCSHYDADRLFENPSFIEILCANCGYQKWIER